MSVAMAADPIRVVVVEDHEVTRQGIKTSLCHDSNIKVVGEAASSNEAISLIGQIKPDVAIVDIRLCEGSGIDVSKAAKTIAPSTKILILSAYDDDQYVAALVKLGVSGYLVKTASAQQLRRAVHDAAEGWLVFAPQVAPKVLGLLSGNNGSHSQRALGTRNPTARETEVLQHMADGLRNAEIATAMSIAVKTVEAHTESVLVKLGAKSRTEAVVIALQRGWLQETQA